MTKTITPLLHMTNKKPALPFALATLLALTGCASSLNPAGSGDFACPGMPMGVTCKTPAAVYKSSHGSVAATDFDTPIGSPSVAPASISPSSMSAAKGVSGAGAQPAAVQGAGVADAAKSLTGYSLPILTAAPRKATSAKPVREAAQVMRIWVAPWVSSGDVLHLAQLHYAEIVPRTWTVGKPEVLKGAGYVIPHIAFNNIGAAEAAPSTNSRPEQRVSAP